MLDAERIAAILDAVVKPESTEEWLRLRDMVRELCDALEAAQDNVRRKAIAYALVAAERDALLAENENHAAEWEAALLNMRSELDAALAENTELRATPDGGWFLAATEGAEHVVQLTESRDQLASQVTDLTAWLEAGKSRSHKTWCSAPNGLCVCGLNALLARLTPTEEPGQVNTQYEQVGLRNKETGALYLDSAAFFRGPNPGLRNRGQDSNAEPVYRRLTPTEEPPT